MVVERTPVSASRNTEHSPDSESVAATVPETVMAEQVTNDVVKEAQSVGRPAPIDDTASTTNTPAAHGELPAGHASTNSTTSEPSSKATSATSADAVPADSARASGGADGAATEVMKDRHGTCRSILRPADYGRRREATAQRRLC
jgi:hypothetical protein